LGYCNVIRRFSTCTSGDSGASIISSTSHLVMTGRRMAGKVACGVGTRVGITVGRVISGGIGSTGPPASDGTLSNDVQSVLKFAAAAAFASAKLVCLSNEVLVKGDSVAADAMVKQIAIARQVLIIIFHCRFMDVTPCIGASSMAPGAL